MTNEAWFWKALHSRDGNWGPGKKFEKQGRSNLKLSIDVVANQGREEIEGCSLQVVSVPIVAGRAVVLMTFRSGLCLPLSSLSSTQASLSRKGECQGSHGVAGYYNGGGGR